MSAANLSRVENGDQGPPADETIERLARALNADPAELLALAGRAGSPVSSEAIMREVRQLRADVKDGLARVEAAIRKR
jgi:transcriptional regulator with XRE-family HTH domain